MYGATEGSPADPQRRRQADEDGDRESEKHRECQNAAVDVNVRRAVNLAVDRRVAVDVTGGPDAGDPTCQVLPAGLPGRRPVCPFTVAVLRIRPASTSACLTT